MTARRTRARDTEWRRKRRPVEGPRSPRHSEVPDGTSRFDGSRRLSTRSPYRATRLGGYRRLVTRGR